MACIGDVIYHVISCNLWCNYNFITCANTSQITCHYKQHYKHFTCRLHKILQYLLQNILHYLYILFTCISDHITWWNSIIYMLYYNYIYINITCEITSFYTISKIHYMINYMKWRFQITHYLHQVLQMQLHYFYIILHVSELFTSTLHIYLHTLLHILLHESLHGFTCQFYMFRNKLHINYTNIYMHDYT